MVRYLVLLECFLIVLLAWPWLGGALSSPDGSEQPAATTDAANPAGDRGKQQRPGDAYLPRVIGLSAADRAEVATELLGIPATVVPAADGRPSPENTRKPARSTDLASLTEEGSAPANAREPSRATNLGRPAAPAQAEESDIGHAANVATAQRSLARLGYAPGAADGVLGERTRRALADYRRRIGASNEGPLTNAILVQLRRDADQIAPRPPRSRRLTSASVSIEETAPNWVGSIAGGFQRFLAAR